MATYHQWNNAIIDYVTQGLNVGSRVFLSIDDEVLETIGFSFGLERPQIGWNQDFIRSVKSFCLHRGQINLSRFTKPSLRDTENRPRYVGFLATMVLAAHYMGEEVEDKTIDSKDFFSHFNRLLDLTDQQGRPKGLDSGEDEKLWIDWSMWLRSCGFLPTTRPGDGAYKYVNYPISQALIRQSDRKKLWRHFSNNSWRKNYDEVLLMQRIRRDAQYLTTHLQDLLDPKGDTWLRLYDAISSACYEVYEEWREADGDEARQAIMVHKIRTSLESAIYRTEDFLTGSIKYRIYPRQPRKFAYAELTVSYLGENYTLEQDRPGWYMPMWALDQSQLEEGLKVPIHSLNSAIKSLYLPARDFWILTLDPDTPESGIYASWDKGIELGNEFILLVKKQLCSDLKALKEEGLLDWQSSNEVFDGWYEYIGTQILSEPETWTSLNIGNEVLRLTLQPRATFSINLIGGLRAPRGSGWFIGHPPQISISAFLPHAYLSVYDENDQIVIQQTVEAAQVTEIDFPRSGSYRITVEQSGQTDEKLIRILDWQDTKIMPMDFEVIAQKLGKEIYGAWVRR